MECSPLNHLGQARHKHKLNKEIKQFSTWKNTLIVDTISGLFSIHWWDQITLMRQILTKYFEKKKLKKKRRASNSQTVWLLIWAIHYKNNWTQIPCGITFKYNNVIIFSWHFWNILHFPIEIEMSLKSFAIQLIDV